MSQEPYRLLARFYDDLQTEAPARARHARAMILGRLMGEVESACDLGCGTGSTAVELALSGTRMFAVDLSLEMCRQARRKAREAGARVEILCADMMDFRLPERVDLVLCEFNPLNHLSDKRDLKRVTDAVSRAVRPGGYFYFDLNTRRALEELYPGTHWIEQEQFCLLMCGGYDKERQKGWLETDWFLPEDGMFRRERERLEDVWWTDREIRTALRQSGFAKIRRWDGVRVRPPSPENRPGYDSYYLAQKGT